MPKQEYPSLLIFLCSIIYYVYLLDPFKWKPIKRNYKRLLADPKYFRLNLWIAILFVSAGVMSLLLRGGKAGAEAFTMAPILFVLLVKAVNSYSRKYYKRDFILLLRGDVIKTSLSDKLSSFIVILFPLVLSFGAAFFIVRRGLFIV